MLNSSSVIFHVARDGEVIGQFEEAEFASRVRRIEIRSTDYYFVEGMAEWRPVYEYRPSVALPATPTPESVRAAQREVAPRLAKASTRIPPRAVWAIVAVIVILIAIATCHGI